MLKFVLSFIFLFAVQSHAQNTTTSTTSMSGRVPQFSNLYDRFGVGAVLSPLSGSVNIKSKTPGVTFTEPGSERATGLGVEAQYMTFLNGPLGVKGAVGYLSSDVDDITVKTMLAKVSGLVAVSGQAVLELGLNISKSKAESTSLDAGVGFQLGFNYLINRNALFNVSYVNYVSDKDFVTADQFGNPVEYNAELELSGLQAGMTYLF